MSGVRSKSDAAIASLLLAALAGVATLISMFGVLAASGWLGLGSFAFAVSCFVASVALLIIPLRSVDPATPRRGENFAQEVLNPKPARFAEALPGQPEDQRLGRTGRIQISDQFSAKMGEKKDVCATPDEIRQAMAVYATDDERRIRAGGDETVVVTLADGELHSLAEMERVDEEESASRVDKRHGHD